MPALEVVRNTLAKVSRTKVTVKSLWRIMAKKWGILFVLIWNSFKLKLIMVSLFVSIISIAINRRKLTNKGNLSERVIWRRIENQANMKKMTTTNFKISSLPCRYLSSDFPHIHSDYAFEKLCNDVLTYVVVIFSLNIGLYRA